MTASPPPQQPPQVHIRYPEDRAAGEYANGMSVTFNQHELVVDFLVSIDGAGKPTVELVRRMRLPIAMAGDLLSNIAATMDKYEQTFGPIHRPGQ